MRLIDADALKDHIKIFDIGCGCSEDYQKSFLNAIDEQPTIEPEQRWTPVTEKLSEGTVIVTAETKTFKHKYVCEAVWIPRWTCKAEYDNWEDCTEYNEDEDEYYVLEGWYERVHNWDEYSYVGIEDDVIAWMPLPEPYSERRKE